MFIVAACSSDEPTPALNQPIDTEKVVQSLSGTRSIDEAADIARDAIGMLPKGNNHIFSCYVFDTSKARLDDPNKPTSASYTKVKILPVYCY